jgi:hypothetical protein
MKELMLLAEHDVYGYMKYGKANLLKAHLHSRKIFILDI